MWEEEEKEGWVPTYASVELGIVRADHTECEEEEHVICITENPRVPP